MEPHSRQGGVLMWQCPEGAFLAARFAHVLSWFLLWRVTGLQITEQAREGSLVDVVLFPRGEVSDMTAAADIGGPGQGGLHDLLIERDGNKDELLVVLFLFQRCHDLVLHPGAVDRVLREND
jgi:hypothetical protein